MIKKYGGVWHTDDPLISQAHCFLVVKQELARYGSTVPVRMVGEADPSGGAGKSRGFGPVRIFRRGLIYL